jgi:uncharacterized protein YabN with tetrapyrrole methylase and pyrophosphatase domain
MKSGSLTVVGTGIQLLCQLTSEARFHIEKSDKVLYLVADLTTVLWIRKTNPSAESLYSFYAPGKNRLTSYLEMVERILFFVRQGLEVCAAFYGHPGIFAYPSHEAVKRARCEGFSAKMLPGISAEDCLFADLNIDPGTSGCQSFEATDFLIYKRKFDPTCSLILWQIGVIGNLDYNIESQNYQGVCVLTDYLHQYYTPEHQVTIYEAAQYPICAPKIHQVPLARLPEALVTGISTLYIPPLKLAVPDAEMLQRLGMLSFSDSSEL